MSHRGAITEPSSTAVQEHDRGPHAALRLLGVPTFVGSYMASASDRRFSFAGMFNTLLRTLLVVTGTGPLNQYLERKFDAHMRRTARRPAAAGLLTLSAVLAFGAALAVVVASIS
jgi:heme O synthase-like polyprenyltransferase